jgi:succinate dehydrogenase/fumarate reductase flavoprotein subunit
MLHRKEEHMTTTNITQSDVLVIGGGIAGCFAAIKAREAGAEVTLVDKGFVGRSGQTAFASDFLIFNPAWGDELDAWMEQVYKFGEYINNRDWTEITFKESYARYQDMLSWGIEFADVEDDIPHRVTAPRGVTKFAMFAEKSWPMVLRKKALELGVKIVDRVMVAELLKQGGRIVGGVGIPVDTEELIVFKTKAVIMASGAAGFKPHGFMIGNLTGDGESMAYRAGAEVSGKEFQDPHWASAEHPATGPTFGPKGKSGPPKGKEAKVPQPRFVNGAGELLPERPDGASGYPFAYMDLEFFNHTGQGPISVQTPAGNIPIVGGASLGMSVRKAEGIFPVDMNCASSVPGLYAAGDSCSNMAAGTVYSPMGSCLAGGAVTGTRAAHAAAKFAAEQPALEPVKDELDRALEFISAPLERKCGYSPRWVIQTLRTTLTPYYVLYVKKADRLQAALTMVEFIRDHFLPKLIAEDMHELRLANETRSIVLNAEMKLRASLERKESRGNHYREDYPLRDDDNWFAWVLLKEEEGKMATKKKEIRADWKPDQSIPYQDRYPYRFPGEQ